MVTDFLPRFAPRKYADSRVSRPVASRAGTAAPSRRVSSPLPGPLDLDDLGAEIGEELRRPRAGEHAGQVQHPQVRERRCSRNRVSHSDLRINTVTAPSLNTELAPRVPELAGRGAGEAREERKRQDDAGGRRGSRRRGRRQFVTALARGLDVLRAFDPGDRQLGNQELARRTGLPKPTISRLTYTLTQLGVSAPRARREQVRARHGGVRPGLAALGQMDVRRIARPLMQALAEHTEASVNLGVRDQLWMVYIDTYRNAASFTVQLDVGSRIPLATTSMGRAYLAALPERERKAVLEEIRESEPERWPELRKGIEQALREHHDRGFCLSLGDWRREVHAVAAAVALPDGSDVLVFSCSGAPFQLDRGRLETTSARGSSRSWGTSGPRSTTAERGAGACTAHHAPMKRAISSIWQSSMCRPR